VGVKVVDAKEQEKNACRRKHVSNNLMKHDVQRKKKLKV